MKIIIETSESERATLQPQDPSMVRQAAGSMADIVAVDAGPPSEALLQSLSNRADTQAFAMSDGEGQEGYQSVIMDEASAASYSRH
jgi:hypothetical protein